MIDSAAAASIATDVQGLLPLPWMFGEERIDGWELRTEKKKKNVHNDVVAMSVCFSPVSR